MIICCECVKYYANNLSGFELYRNEISQVTCSHETSTVTATPYQQLLAFTECLVNNLLQLRVYARSFERVVCTNTA